MKMALNVFMSTNYVQLFVLRQNMYYSGQCRLFLNATLGDCTEIKVNLRLTILFLQICTGLAIQ